MFLISLSHECLKFIMGTRICTPLLLAFLFFLSQNAVSQEEKKKIDSLNEILETSTGKDKFNATLELMRATLKIDPSRSLELSYSAEKIASSINDSLLIEKAIYARGFIQSKINQTKEAVLSLNQALGIAKRNGFETEAVKILNTLAIAYSLTGNYDKSLEYHFQALQINEKIGDKESAGVNFNNIGFVYFKLKDWENAIVHFNKSLELKKEINSTYDLDRLLVNLALSYNQQKKYSEAEQKIKEVFKNCGKNCAPEIIMSAEYSLGVSLSEQGHQAESIEHFEKSFGISKELNDSRFQIENLWCLGATERKIGNIEKAKAYLNESESIALKTNYVIPLIEVYKEFSTLYIENKDYKNSALYQSKYITLKDSIYSEELIKNLAKVQTNFAERENIKTIKEKNEVLVLQEKLLEKQRELSAFIVAITLIVLSFAFAFIIFQRKYSKRLKESNLKLEEKVLERTQDLKKTNEKLEKAQGDLRNFLYKTSHDIRGPVATLKGLNNLGFDNLNDLTFTKELLEKKSTQIEKMIRILSRITIVADITNAILEAVEIDFPKLVNDITEFERKNGQLKHIKVSMEVEPNLKVISDPIILRMILENMIDNSLKFFNESKRIEPYVKISVKSVGSDAMILVEDNGVGIEVKPHQDVFTMFMRGSEKSETGGVGLYLCKICTDRLQGTIKLEKTAKTGTTFSIRIAQDATEQIKEMNEALIAQLRKEEPPKIELEEDAPF